MVSIIVPVYNVEKYLKRCIDSIIEQTYTDWELLLIDDGSYDNSGKICDEYAENDRRIKCFHKENGGQSSARNLGLEYAKGTEIVFCDSDDWLVYNFLELCMQERVLYGVDIVTTNYYCYYNDKKCEPIFKIKGSNSICENRSAMKRLLNNDGTSSSVCARMYDRDIFKELRFRDGMLFEDVAISYKLFIKAKKVSFISEPLMYYYQREGSTMSRRDKKIRLDEIQASYERYETVRELYDDEIAEAAISDYVYDIIHVTECFIRDGYNLNELQGYDDYLRGELEKYQYHFGQFFSRRKKMEAYLWLHFPKIFNTIVSKISHIYK